MPFTFTTDVAALWPRYAEFRDALRRLDWSAARAVLDTVTPAERTRLIELGADERLGEDFVRGLVRQDPGDPAAFALLGKFLTVTGWNIRTAAGAQHVSREQWRAFFHWVNLAEEVLLEGAARHPGDPAIWTARLPSARGISLGIDEETRRYNRLAAIDQHHLPGQTHHLQQLLPKWSGTAELAHTFARERVAAAPPGSPQGLLIAQWHLEQFEALSGEQYQQHLRQGLPDLRAAADRSVLDPNFVTGTYTADVVLGTFALALRQFGDREYAGRVFRLMGNRASMEPWDRYSEMPSGALYAASAWARGGKN